MQTKNSLPTLLLALTATLAATAQQHFTILTDQPRQTICHFGASDAWTMQDMGTWGDEATVNRVADWLFSLETDAHGQPRGIGLSIWRFNLGAGSAEQGEAAQIQPSTRTECLLRADGTYDWTRQAGQRRFLRLARQRGVPHFLAFLNSAPVHFTQNGLATNTGRGATINLRDDGYEPFARFMATALKGLEERDSIHFDYISPVNEPDGHWNWLGPKQEGSPATNRETARLVRLLSRELQRQGLYQTQILVNESSDLRCLLGIYQTTWERGNTISTFFCPDSTETYLGDTPQVARLMAAHSYWTNTPVGYMAEIRRQLSDTLARYGAGYWQTELCIMANDEEIGGGNGYDLTMQTALYVARVIHHDLVLGDAASWSWWRAAGGNYKDGLLRIYRDHRVSDSRLLWTLGNFSRFVRPGAVRHELDTQEAFDPYGVMCSAYRNADGHWVVVAINYSHSQQALTFNLSNGYKPRWKLYRTSDVEGETLKPVGNSYGEAQLPPRSVTTFVSDGL